MLVNGIPTLTLQYSYDHWQMYSKQPFHKHIKHKPLLINCLVSVMSRFWTLCVLYVWIQYAKDTVWQSINRTTLIYSTLCPNIMVPWNGGTMKTKCIKIHFTKSWESALQSLWSSLDPHLHPYRVIHVHACMYLCVCAFLCERYYYFILTTQDDITTFQNSEH